MAQLRFIKVWTPFWKKKSLMVSRFYVAKIRKKYNLKKKRNDKKINSMEKVWIDLKNRLAKYNLEL